MRKTRSRYADAVDLMPSRFAMGHMQETVFLPTRLKAEWQTIGITTMETKSHYMIIEVFALMRVIAQTACQQSSSSILNHGLIRIPLHMMRLSKP